ncbi:hypothetical protein J2797_003462 [Paraburkholderia terricola]|uniref:hypothetical protein n=1 Tax=Paraburkholderia terricola TaxID=169427 RepID=UPI002856EEEC|nr:hypothetical protein [Paraburkholderia terricola]MDR6493564.1 hypothetical protein [Paraburkholderia terricola]
MSKKASARDHAKMASFHTDRPRNRGTRERTDAGVIHPIAACRAAIDATVQEVIALPPCSAHAQETISNEPPIFTTRSRRTAARFFIVRSFDVEARNA